MVKIKICGIKRIEDVEYVNEYLPDYVGFVFAETKRKVTDDMAGKLKASLNPSIETVGVFVNDDIRHIASLAERNIIDVIQLHGDEDKKYIHSLRNLTGKPIIKAVRVRETEDILKAEEMNADYLLLDTYVKDMYGGSGRTFDKKMIPQTLKNYFLAGGLSAENLEQILRECVCTPYAIDISSGVETDGFKDREKIKKVIEIVRNFRLQ